MGAYATAVMADTPVGYWKLDEASGNFADSSGNAITATAAGEITYQAAGPLTLESPNYAATFSYETSMGTGTTADNDLLDPGTGDFTVEAWVKVVALGTGLSFLVCKGTGTTSAYRGIEVKSDHVLKGLVADATGYVEPTCSNAFTDTNWNHLVITFDRDGNATGYINGSIALAAAISGKAGAVANATGLVIGRPSVLHQSVTMAHVAYYSGLLSSTRIAAHYTAATASAWAGPHYYKDTYSLSELTGGLT
jgi:hypothetical protein